MLMDTSHASSLDGGNPKHKRLYWLFGAVILLAVVLAGLIIWLVLREGREENRSQSSTTNEGSEQLAGVPQLETQTVVEGLEHVWDVKFLPSGELLLTERGGTLSVIKGEKVSVVAEISGVRARGEGGLMGLAVDPDFEQNRYIYVCFNSVSGGDVRVARWRLAEGLDRLEDRRDIVTGMPANTSGRHSGCRIGFGPDGYLWIGAGDSASDGAIPQDPQSLGGKILRVDRGGQAADEGNLGGGFDPRIYSYGHRNTQGLAFLRSPVGGVPGVSVEHGPRTDDEVNQLKPGNFGWDPVPGYNESLPMTDRQKFPDAVQAVWSSGDPTQAPSGAAFVYGGKWRDWNGALAVAFLKDQRLKFLFFDDSWQLTDEKELFVQEFGRLRGATLGPDEALYITTSNGQDDKIIRVSP